MEHEVLLSQLALRLHVRVVESGKMGVGVAQQHLRVPSLHHPARTHDHDRGAAHDVVQTARHLQAGAVREVVVDRLLHDGGGVGVHRSGGLVQAHNARRAQQNAHQTHQLRLRSRQHEPIRPSTYWLRQHLPIFVRHRLSADLLAVAALWLTGCAWSREHVGRECRLWRHLVAQRIPKVSCLQHRLDLLILETAVGVQIFAQAASEEERLLRDNIADATEPPHRYLRDVNTVDVDSPIG
mmetsp:Transcript_22352/g.39877  ORF Transcript_22352/g.39877 Transcript_22352/m.39877 type:complete len:239 (+) Transcript_22352:122-838(+)